MKKFAGLIAATILASGFAPADTTEPVAARNVRPGEILTAADFETPKTESGLRRAASFVGMEATRAIYRGERVTDEDIRAQTLIERNAIVRMEFMKGPLAISAEGRALEPGPQGGRIRVMNLISRRIVTATVVSSDTVRTKQ